MTPTGDMVPVPSPSSREGWYLLECFAVADWRQIQVRIRKAKTGLDAPDKLTRLYDKTHDAMVAYELALVLENAGQTETAVHWYTTAVQRFRRADWRKKAEDALTRLGAPVPAVSAELAAHEEPERHEAAPVASVETHAEEPEPAEPQAETVASGAAPSGEVHKRRRRGRRGGRRRSKRGREQAAPVAAPAPRMPLQAKARPEPAAMPAPPPPPPPRRFTEPEPTPEPAPERFVSPALRTGDPGLTSRMARLESQLRRLIASQTFPLDEVEQAPAGPGVWLLSDTDQVTHYYVESCQTLRIALGQLVKGRAGGRLTGFSLRPILAKHLGISEAKVKDYLREHCTVRWVQIDEGAPHLAHFAVAVLRPVLNE